MTAREFQNHYKELLMPLGMLALRIVENVDEANDVVQDTFLAVWQKVESGEAPQNFKAYMFAAVRNAALNAVKQRRSIVDIDEVGPITDEEIDTAERDARLWRAVDALPEKCRQVLLMSKRDGMSHAQIAEELDISVKTVENQLAKAMSRLRGHTDLKILMFFV